MRIVCSWCQTVLVVGDVGALTSHVICSVCAARLHAELDVLEAAAAVPPCLN